MKPKKVVYQIGRHELAMTCQMEPYDGFQAQFDPSCIELCLYITGKVGTWTENLQFDCCQNTIRLAAKDICETAYGKAWNEKSEICRCFRVELINAIRKFMGREWS